MNENMARLHSYIVARDYGFAPNPFYGYCTLATCKPNIRKAAVIGDWVVGTGSKTKQRDGHLVYVMQVSEVMTLDEYWRDPCFQNKRPDMRASMKKAFGDNIYHRNIDNGSWRQADSHHTLKDGAVNIHNLRRDTSVDKMLVSDDFIYFGGTGPQIPTFQEKNIVHSGIGHSNKFPEKVVEEFVEWIRSLNRTGYCGPPLDWGTIK